MLLKDGSTMPKILYEVLARDSHAMVIFMNMSEAYQQICVRQLMDNSGEKSMRERMDETIQAIYRYGKAHGI